MKRIVYIACLGLLIFVSACTKEQPPYSGLKIGDSYWVNGRRYTPEYESHYDETGMASWYGPGFHGGKTASGERFDQDALTAAHRTLPLPSIVRVTSLDNGRSAIIRINDRGPFAHSRIIDLSKGSATALGIIGTGTAKVRVQFLDKETREYVEKLHGGSSLMAQNEPLPQHVEVENLAPAAAPPTKMIVINNSNVPYHDPNDEFSVVDNSPVPVVQPQSNAVSAQGYFIQAGTFGSKTNANNRLQQVSEVSSAQINEVMVGGRNLYRVMTGPFNTQADAKNMLSKLAALGISDTKIIRK